MTNIDDILDERQTGQGDFPEWWDPEAEGDQLQGIVTARRENPWADEDEDDPMEMLWIQTENGEYSTRTHKILSNLVKDQDVNPRDYVRVVYTGEESTDNGYNAKNYEMAVVREDELEEKGIEIPEADGGAALQRPIPQKAIEFTENLMDFHGELDVEELDRFLNEVNTYDLSPEDVVEETDYSIDNGVVR